MDDEILISASSRRHYIKNVEEEEDPNLVVVVNQQHDEDSDSDSDDSTMANHVSSNLRQLVDERFVSNSGATNKNSGSGNGNDCGNGNGNGHGNGNPTTSSRSTNRSPAKSYKPSANDSIESITNAIDALNHVNKRSYNPTGKGRRPNLKNSSTGMNMLLDDSVRSLQLSFRQNSEQGFDDDDDDHDEQQQHHHHQQQEINSFPIDIDIGTMSDNSNENKETKRVILHCYLSFQLLQEEIRIIEILNIQNVTALVLFSDVGILIIIILQLEMVKLPLLSLQVSTITSITTTRKMMMLVKKRIRNNHKKEEQV